MGSENSHDMRTAASVPDYDLRPVQNEAGTWDALDAQGYGHVLEFPTAEWVETWIDGYNTGARENA